MELTTNWSGAAVIAMRVRDGISLPAAPCPGMTGVAFGDVLGMGDGRDGLTTAPGSAPDRPLL